MKSNRISRNLLVDPIIDGQSFEEVRNFKYLVTSTVTKEEFSEDMQLNFAEGNKIYIYIYIYYGVKQVSIYRAVIYILNPWNRVLEKLTSSHLVKKFPAFYGTQRFITAFTRAHHLHLSWARSIQSMPPHPTSGRSILILSSHLRLGLSMASFPHVSPPKPCIHLSFPP